MNGDDSTTYLIIETQWSDTDVKIRLLECDDAVIDPKEWHGTFEKTKIEEFASEFEIPLEQFFEETRTALSTNNGQPGFIYTVTDDSKFVWKKKIESLKLTYGTCNLVRCSNIKNAILLNSLAIIDGLRSELESRSTELADFQKTHESFVDRFEKLIEEKSKYEDDLFTKFFLLLNTKKQKIGDLQDLVNEKSIQMKSDGRKDVGFSDSEELTDIDSQETLIDEEPIELDTKQATLKRKNSEDFTQSPDLNIHVPKRAGTIHKVLLHPVKPNNKTTHNKDFSKKTEKMIVNTEMEMEKFDQDTEEYIDNF